MQVTSEQQVEVFFETGWLLWMTAHNNTPAAQRVYRWMSDVVPGHLVLETTSSALVEFGWDPKEKVK